MCEAQPLPGLCTCISESKIARLRNDICKAYMTTGRPDQPVKLASKTDRRNLQDQQVQGGLTAHLSDFVQCFSAAHALETQCAKINVRMLL